MGVDSLENLFSLGGEDSYLHIYDKSYPNYVAIAIFSQYSYVSGCVAWGLARGVYLVVLTTQPSLEDYNVVYSVHACAARYNN